MCLRMTMNSSCCKETSSSCLQWSRALPVRAGCTALRWAQGCPAYCLKTTLAALMSLTRGSSTGEERHSSAEFTGANWAVRVKLNMWCLIDRSHSFLNCASPSTSGTTVSGLLLDGQLNDSLLDSFMEASSLTGLCSPMQVHYNKDYFTTV